LNNKTRRLDYIDITNINDRSNKKKNKKYAQTTIKNKNKQKKKIEKVEMKDIIFKMKPINYIINNKIDKKENNNIEKKLIENKNKNKQEENIFVFDICKQKYEDNVKNENIEIIFGGNDNKVLQYNLFKDSLLNLNNLPQKQKKIIENYENYEKIVNIPNKIYKKSVLSKPLHEITFMY